MSIKSSLNRLRNAIKNINVYKPRWEQITTSGTDRLGDFTVHSSTTDYKSSHDISNNTFCKFYSYKLLVGGEINSFPTGIYTPNNFSEGVYLDMSLDGTKYENDSEVVTDSDSSYPSNNGGKRTIALNPARIIFPKRFCSLYARIFTFIRSGASTEYDGKELWGGLFLPQQLIRGSSSLWIYTDHNEMLGQNLEYGIKVDAYDGVDYNLYLEKLTLTAATMDTLINRLADNSNSTNTRIFSVGSDNLAKLSTVQKNAILKKGWEYQ